MNGNRLKSTCEILKQPVDIHLDNKMSFCKPRSRLLYFPNALILSIAIYLPLSKKIMDPAQKQIQAQEMGDAQNLPVGENSGND